MYDLCLILSALNRFLHAFFTHFVCPCTLSAAWANVLPAIFFQKIGIGLRVEGPPRAGRACLFVRDGDRVPSASYGTAIGDSSVILVLNLWDSSSAFSIGRNDFNDDGVCIFPKQKSPISGALVFYYIFDYFYRLPVGCGFYVGGGWVFFVDFACWVVA